MSNTAVSHSKAGVTTKAFVNIFNSFFHRFSDVCGDSVVLYGFQQTFCGKLVEKQV